jgi:uncharacterized membrane protein YbhN (UPF0104 family)
MAWAVHIHVPWVLLAWVWSVLMLLRQLPISFQGVGLREAALVVLLGPFGVAREAAFALGTIVFLNLVLFALLGLILRPLLTLKLVRLSSRQATLP